ncbi:UDP-N-acetylmuramoylalanyl-D-glutamate--2,6-diaminopimelate ligase [plant metagenome]|uniref:UDP-MurNAc-pentapeptide synthetase n=1 Tax=plant metagenome TaxID=1297885 RepID=A0A484NX26_9ZZZZ
MSARIDTVQGEGAGDLLAWLRTRVAAGAHLSLDTRKLHAGDVFVACPGRSGDGRLHLAEAVAHGAAAIIAEARDVDQATLAAAGQVPVLLAEDLRARLGALADAWYGEPSRALKVIAITGTNGKTSCTQWIAAGLNSMNRPCGVIGTLGTFMPDGSQAPGALTTPDVLTLHRSLAALRDAGAALVAIEASSIGIEQGRLDGVRIALAGWTNLTRDHLDYHGTLEAYEAAKQRLFQWPGLGAAVVNVDDVGGRRLLETLGDVPAVTYSIDPNADAMLRARDIHDGAHGMVFTLHTPEGEAQIVSHLVGEHNVSNLLLVAGVFRALGVSLGGNSSALAAAQPVAGRLQPVPAPLPDEAERAPLVVVDYAHTPDALARVLAALRSTADARRGQLICVFGCGGNRDAGKRPEMARAAEDGADAVVVTSDNPRDEAPADIIAQVRAGFARPGAVQVIEDRAQAILRTIWQSAPQDVVLLAGKGHETYQEIAGQRLPFDDVEWARLAMLWSPQRRLSSDTRSLRAGELFVALSGENFDGHAYLAQAHAAGACAAMVAYHVPDAPLPQLVLGETRAAMGKLAAAWRAGMDLPLIAVTGSNGKTTTKEMISAILAAWVGEDRRLATAGNLNNDIGVPLTLLRLGAHHRAAVVELGMNHPGEIEGLARMAAPTVALVNNAQREHQEFMHTVEAVARENGAVLSALPADGVAVYPGDDAHAHVWDALSAGHAVRRFGLDAAQDVYATEVALRADGVSCMLHTPAGTCALVLAVAGQHNLRNALAAVSCALAAGVPLPVAVQALAGFQPVKGRMQHRTLPDGGVLIDDTYNANPDSVRAAIDVLASLPAPRALVLGDMGEVGNNGPAMHIEVGAYARERGIDLLYTLGTACRDAAAAFGPAAMAGDSVEDIVRSLQAAHPASILVKGSRFMRMERIVSAYLENKNTQEDSHAA